MDDRGTLRIEAELVLTGTGTHVEDGVVVIERGAVMAVGPQSEVRHTGGAVVEVRTLLPGLWDSHVHFWGAVKGDSLTRATTPAALAGARSASDARRLLAEGVTSARCLGGYGVEVGQVVREGALPGPRVYGSGAMLTIVGGHGDISSAPPPWPQSGGTRRICSGVEDCVRAVREQIRRGADVIKVCTTGGVMSDADLEERQFSDDELKAVVDEAQRARRPVAAHAHGLPGILAAIDAGVTTVEHGSHLDERAAHAMRAAGTILVPTRSILEHAVQRDDLGPDAVERARRIEEASRQAVRVAIEAGVRIAAGSDLGVSGSEGSLSYSRVRSELAALARVGLTGSEAVVAATGTGPATLGPRRPRSGRLEVGYPADALAVDFDPLGHPELWDEPGRVTKVWVSGVEIDAMSH